MSGTRSQWSIAMSGTREEKLALAAAPSTSGDLLAAVAPGYQDADPDLDVVRLVLAHPHVPAGVVTRYATSKDPDIRLSVVNHPCVTSTALQTLELDPDPQIAAIARRRLEP